MKVTDKVSFHYVGCIQIASFSHFLSLCRCDTCLCCLAHFTVCCTSTSSLTLCLHVSRGVKMLLLLSCWILSGVMAEVGAVKHYRMRNSSICLNVTKPPPYIYGSWKFAGQLIATEGIINPRFEKKVDFNATNLRFCIKDLTDTDSGIYEAIITERNFTQSTEKHRVIVQDSVPRPVLHTSLLHPNTSSGLCSLAVNCSVRDEWASASCDRLGCRASQRSSPEVISINISTNNWTVVCSAKNQVSSRNQSEDLEAACLNKPAPGPTVDSLPVFAIVLLVVMCVSLFGFIGLLAQKVSSGCCHHQRQVLVEEQPETRASTSSSSPSEVAYENVNAPQPAEEGGAAPSQEVETVYSVLQAANVTPPPVEAETWGEAPPPLTEGGAGLSEVNTLYSVLQKPKTLKSQRHQQVT